MSNHLKVIPSTYFIIKFSQESHHKAAMEQIYSADRASLLSEIRDVRSHNHILQLDLTDDRQKLTQQLSSLEEHGSRREKQLKRQRKYCCHKTLQNYQVVTG